MLEKNKSTCQVHSCQSAAAIFGSRAEMFKVEPQPPKAIVFLQVFLVPKHENTLARLGTEEWVAGTSVRKGTKEAGRVRNEKRQVERRRSYTATGAKRKSNNTPQGRKKNPSRAAF